MRDREREGGESDRDRALSPRRTSSQVFLAGPGLFPLSRGARLPQSDALVGAWWGALSASPGLSLQIPPKWTILC
jgi:hypothetical protein